MNKTIHQLNKTFLFHIHKNNCEHKYGCVQNGRRKSKRSCAEDERTVSSIKMHVEVLLFWIAIVLRIFFVLPNRILHQKWFCSRSRKQMIILFLERLKQSWSIKFSKLVERKNQQSSRPMRFCNLTCTLYTTYMVPRKYHTHQKYISLSIVRSSD